MDIAIYFKKAQLDTEQIRQTDIDRKNVLKIWVENQGGQIVKKKWKNWGEQLCRKIGWTKLDNKFGIKMWGKIGWTNKEDNLLENCV